MEFLKNHNFANFNEVIIQAAVLMFAKTVKSRFSTRGHFLFGIHLAISGGIFLLSHIPIRWCVWGKSVESTRDPTKYHVVYRTVPHNKVFSGPTEQLI